MGLMASFLLEEVVEKQQVLKQQWENARSRVVQLKGLGNMEMQDPVLGAEFAVKSYREGLRMMGEYKLEEEELEVAFRSNLSEALARQNLWTESEEESGKVLKLQPDHAKALFRRGRARLRLNELEGARADLTKAVRASPGDRVLREYLEDVKRVSAGLPAKLLGPGGTLARLDHPGVPQTLPMRLRQLLAWFWQIVQRQLPGMRRQLLGMLLFSFAVIAVGRLRNRIARRALT